MKMQAKIKIIILCGSLMVSGLVMSIFNRAEAVWSGGGYFCSTSHMCYDHRYPCEKPSGLNCSGGSTQVNCDNYGACRANYNGWSRYYSCGYDKVACSETRYCIFATGVASWSACSATGLQWAKGYNFSTVYGTTACSDSNFATTRFCEAT